MKNELSQEDKELIAKIDERLKHYKLIADNEQVDKEIYVECIDNDIWPNSITEGKIYLVNSEIGDTYNIVDNTGYEHGYFKHRFKPSTKEAYLKQFLPDNEQQAPVETDETPVFWVSFKNVDGFNPKKIYTAKISKGLMVSYNDYGHTYYFKTEKAIFHTYEEYIANAEILSNEAPVEWKVGVWAEPITEQKERWKIEVYQPNITGDEGFKIHIEPTFKLRKPLAEQAAQAIRETLENL